eukprot:6005403-Prymnesium_polylepis.1
MSRRTLKKRVKLSAKAIVSAAADAKMSRGRSAARDESSSRNAQLTRARCCRSAVVGWWRA